MDDNGAMQLQKVAEGHLQVTPYKGRRTMQSHTHSSTSPCPGQGTVAATYPALGRGRFSGEAFSNLSTSFILVAGCGSLRISATAPAAPFRE